MQSTVRLDPTNENYLAAIDEFIKKAKNEPGKKFLLFVVCASHGYHADGCQECLSPYFDNETYNYEYIQVQKTVREKFKNVLNAYCVVHVSCCREIKKMSDAEVDKLKEDRDEKKQKKELKE